MKAKSKEEKLKKIIEMSKEISESKQFLREWEKENKDHALMLKMFFEMSETFKELKKHKKMDLETAYKAMSMGLKMAYEFKKFQDSSKENKV